MRKDKAPEPSKLAVPPVLDRNWDVNKHRVRMRYSGGEDAAMGTAGTWSVDHAGGPGIAQFATPPEPIIKSIWDMK